MTLATLWEWVNPVLQSRWVHAGVVFALGWFITRRVARMVSSRMAEQEAVYLSFIAYKFVRYSGIIVVFLAVGRALKIDLTAFVATAGLATVAVGFASQTSLSNIIAGLFLLVDRPFRVGEVIELEGRMGYVTEISLLSTIVRTFDNILVRWPNEVVLKATISNLTRYPVRRLDLSVRVTLGADIALARQVLTQAIQKLPHVLVHPEAQVIVTHFLDSAVELQVRAWVDSGDIVEARTQLIETMHTTLEQNGMAIPFPQHTVHMADNNAG